ncbi:hypothetical protein O3M35_000702 [Rhynocoris fuscipes]|uniref:Uncharacterized protein n=1 Tax=Rhynocoris fuscipes TaxID=488301 RepID=A0AAW1DMQ0_9HEMI
MERKELCKIERTELVDVSPGREWMKPSTSRGNRAVSENKDMPAIYREHAELLVQVTTATYRTYLRG